MSSDMRTDTREDLAEIRAWINHWAEDAKCGLVPTDSSLFRAKAIADRLLAAKADTAAARSTVRVAA